MAAPVNIHHSCYPNWLIDTRRKRLVPARLEDSYITLSYVWGGTDCLKTVNNNIGHLQLENAFSNQELLNQIPRTIRDARCVVTLFQKRYLWVDSLCLLQDDEAKGREQLDNMFSIYGNASVTIIAAQGADAQFGLRESRGISQPRQLNQEVCNLTKGEKLIERLFHYPDSIEYPGPWYDRNWTFQEHLCSRRRSIFECDSVRLECSHAIWYEDVDVK